MPDLVYVGFFEAGPGTLYTGRRVERDVQEIEIITEGMGTFTWQGNAYPADPGSFLWFCSEDPIIVRADADSPYKTCVLRFRETDPAESRPPFFSRWSSVSSCREFCQAVLRRYRLGELGGNLPECVYTRLYWEADEYRRRRRQVAVAPAVQHALSYIEQHFAEPLGVADIAARAGVSTPYLHALFRQHTGLSPKQTILRFRIQKAEALLTFGKLSIKEVSQAAGFSDVSSFCAYFRRLTGCTPGTYRRRYGGA